MKKRYIKLIPFLSLAALFCPGVISGQITFEKIHTAEIHESGKDILQTSDGGYIIAASTETSINDDLDVMIVKTNSIGDTLWKKRYGGNLPDYPNCILEAGDGNYFVIGYTQSAGSGDSDYYLLKINPAGDSLFSRVYGGYGNEEGKEIIPTTDGNYVIVGASNSISFSDNNMQLIKIDLNGNQIWTKYYGGTDYESSRSVKQCADGGYIVAGKTINAAGMSSIQLVRTNTAGDATWTKTFGGTNSLEGKSILVNTDGSYTLSVDDSSTTSDSDVRIMKIDPTGNVIIWDQTYGGNLKDITKMIQHTSDGGYIVAGLSRSFGWVEPDYWLLKLNAMGDTLWTRHFGGVDHEHCYAAKQTSDGGYIAVGHTRSNNIDRVEEIFLVKLNSLGGFGPVGVNEYAQNDNTLMVYPNPSNGTVNISLTGKYESGSVCKIMNTMGELVHVGEIDPAGQNNVIDLKNNARGIYYISIQSADQLITKKLILN